MNYSRLRNNPDAFPAFRENVLCIDESVLSRHVYRVAFRLLGVSVDVAADGYDALRLLKVGTRRYSLVLLEAEMRIVPCNEVIRLLRDLESIPEICVAQSDCDPIEQRRFSSAGANYFLQKPLELSRIRDLLQRVGIYNRLTRGESAKGDDLDYGAPAAAGRF